MALDVAADETPTDRSVSQLVLLLLLLAAYAVAPTISLISALLSIGPGGSIENDMLMKVLPELAKNPSAYTGILQQMIVPVAAVVTVGNFAGLRSAALFQWLFILPFVTLFICLADALMFNSMTLSNSIGDKTADAGTIGAIFLNMASTLAVYVMTLVGLQLSSK